MTTGSHGVPISEKFNIQNPTHLVYLSMGDRFGIGTVKLMVTQPRLPCYKLGIRFGRPDMVKGKLKTMNSQPDRTTTNADELAIRAFNRQMIDAWNR